MAGSFASPARAQERGLGDRLGQMFGRQPQPQPQNLDDEDDQPTIRQTDNNASVRIDRLENQIRSLTGQIEQLQFSIRKLEDQLRAGPAAGPAPGRRADEGAPPAVVATTPSGGTTPGSSESSRLRRGDAFDPASQPNAPGAPRQIGTLSGPSATPASIGGGSMPRGPIQGETGTPMDLSGGRIANNGAVVDRPAPTGSIVGTPLPSGASSNPPMAGVPATVGLPGQSSVPATGGERVTPGGTVIASHEPFSPKEEYEMATGYLKGGQYEAAEKGLTTFIAKNPKNRLVPDAVFNLGESYFQRGRHREAAEQYLKMSTTYSNNAHAAEAMLRLGQSLGALGAKEQACASFAEVARKYPNASPTVRSAADREAKKSAC